MSRQNTSGAFIKGNQESIKTGKFNKDKVMINAVTFNARSEGNLEYDGDVHEIRTKIRQLPAFKDASNNTPTIKKYPTPSGLSTLTSAASTARRPSTPPSQTTVPERPSTPSRFSSAHASKETTQNPASFRLNYMSSFSSPSSSYKKPSTIISPKSITSCSPSIPSNPSSAALQRDKDRLAAIAAKAKALDDVCFSS